MKSPPQDSYIPVTERLPFPNLVVWIKGPQLSPIRAKYIPNKEFKPCWFPVDIPLRGIGQYAEAVLEWAHTETEDKTHA